MFDGGAAGSPDSLHFGRETRGRAVICGRDLCRGHTRADEKKALELVDLHARVESIPKIISKISGKSGFDAGASLLNRRGRGGPTGPRIGHGVVIDENRDMPISTFLCQSYQFASIGWPRTDTAALSARLAHERAHESDAGIGDYGSDDGAAELPLGVALTKNEDLMHRSPRHGCCL